MAVKVASLFGVLTLDDSGFTTGVNNAMTGMDKLGSRMTSLGTSVTTLAAPIAAAFGVATNMAVNFDEAMVNIQAVTGRSAPEMAALRDEVMRLGAASRFGPQAAAEAMYDIVGGVGDANVQMAIFRTAISTAQAGNADLGSTTKALISVMNSYKLGADQAGFASDVLTQTVAKGVGTMDEFASALPQVTGLANSLGINFGDLAGNAAYLTTQGNSASQATTQLAAMMTAMLNPNETMKKGLNELGYSSGQAAIQALGLTGAYSALAGTQTANTDGMAKMLGSVEALRGATALAGPDVQTFMLGFRDSLHGATEAAEQVQMTSAAAQVDLLKSSVSELGIEVGTAMIPALKELVAQIGPVITNVTKWVKENPELVKQIGTIAALVAGAGVAITGAGTAISAVSTIVKAATSTWGSLLLAVTAVIAAYKEWEQYKSTVSGAAGAAHEQLAPAIQGGLTRQQIADEFFRQAQSQYGDLGARLMFGSSALNVQGYIDQAYSGQTGQSTQSQLWTGHASGLDYVPYDNYPAMLHEGERVMTKSENMGGGGLQIGTVNVYANDYAGGQAAAKGFAEKMEEWRRSRG